MSTCDLEIIKKIVNSYFLEDRIMPSVYDSQATHFSKDLKFKYIESNDNDRIAFLVYKKLHKVLFCLSRILLKYKFENGYVIVTVHGWF